MKKKLLSLVLAGAMVATTSVSAFAAPISTSNGQINGRDDQEYSTNVTITGQVQNDSGLVNPGTLNVSVPTAASFTVKSDNTVQGTNINIVNGGSQDVDVFAYQFIDTSEASGITVLGESAIATEDRTNVSLKIKGNLSTAYLGSNAGSNKGIYSNADLSQGSGAIKIATVAQNSNENLELSGKAGQKSGQSISNPVTDTFTLVLKIAKTTK
ncbi:hypothetical protein [Clostridium sp.]